MYPHIANIVIDRIFGAIESVDKINNFLNIQGICNITINGRLIRPNSLLAFCNEKQVDCIWHLVETTCQETTPENTYPQCNYSAMLAIKENSIDALALYAKADSNIYYPLNENARLAGRSRQKAALVQTNTYWQRLYGDKVDKTISEQDLMQGGELF